MITAIVGYTGPNNHLNLFIKSEQCVCPAYFFYKYFTSGRRNMSGTKSGHTVYRYLCSNSDIYVLVLRFRLFSGQCGFSPIEPIMWCRYGAGGLASRQLEHLGVAAVSGNYEAGLLQGRVRLHRRDGSLWEGWCHNGRLHGPVRGIAKVGERKRTGLSRVPRGHSMTEQCAKRCGNSQEVSLQVL